MADSSSPFIDRNTASDAYTESKNWLRPYFEPIEELERIARNKPSPKIAPNLPKITDGTLAAVVQEQPKRVVQQEPTGLVNSNKNPEYAKLADIVLRQDLIPHYNRMGNLLQKSWNMLGKAETWGRSTSYTFYTSTNGVFHTDFVIPYVKDILTEKGKVFAPDSNIRFMRSWYQKRDLQAIIRQEQRLEKQNKDYKSDWDLKLLSKLVEGGASAKPADQMNPSEREKGGDTGGYEIIHAFQNGKKAEFYSFSPLFENGKPLRVKVNKDPRGLMPFDDLYCNIDLSNPLGRGQVELSGGVQNLIDQQMQMFQFMSTLEMAPPIKVFGNVNKSQLKFAPNKVWDMGAGGNNDVKPFEISNFALQNFGNNYGLLKSQILNLNSAQDHSISADSGDPTQSKTSAGVNASESRLGVSDNYLRKQFEDWFQDESETSINIYFAEMTGTMEKQLKGDDLKDILDSPAKQFVDEKSGVLKIPYSKINNVAFEFSVDASSSEIKEDQDNVEKLTEVLKVMQSVPDPSIQQKIPQLIKLIVDEIGAEGTDDLFPELKQTDENGIPIQGQGQPQQSQISPEQIQQLVMQTVQQAMQEAEQAKKQQPKTIAESLAIKFSDLPEDAKQQVLQQIGINSNMATPQHTQQQADLVLKADKQAHDTNLALANHEHTTQQAEVQNQLSQQQADQQAQASTQQAQGSATSSPQGSSTQPSTQPQQDQSQGLDTALSPEETQIAHALMQRGFSEGDVEQAVVMLRQGLPLEQVIPTIGAKYAN